MIKAVGDRILVRIVEVEKEKKSILIMPDEKKEHQIGLIFSTGPEVSYLEDGMYVWTRKYAGLILEYGGIEYVSLESKEILAASEELQ